MTTELPTTCGAAVRSSDWLDAIVCGDCLNEMAKMPDESVDVVITSPPYNMGLIPGGNGRGMYRPGANNKAGRFREGYGVHDDAMTQEDYDNWQRKCLNEMWRVSRMGVFYNHRPRVEHGKLRLPLSMNFGDAVLRQIIIWDRKTGIDVNLRHFCTRQEWVLMFAKPAMKLVSHAESGRGDVWRLGMEHRETGHPAPFPESLPESILKATGAESVLDPFAGSGTTLRSAQKLNRRAIGIEINPDYVQLIRKRLDEPYAHELGV